MKNLIWIAIGIILILLALLYFNSQAIRDVKVQREKERALFKKKEDTYRAQQSTILLQLDTAKNAYADLLRKNEESEARHTKEVVVWKARVKKARTEHVENLIQADDSLKQFVAYQDSLIDRQGLQIDSMKINNRIEEEMRAIVDSKTNSYIASVEGERDFLREEIVARDSIIDVQDAEVLKYKKRAKRNGFLAGLLGLLNFVPRGG